MLGSAQDLHASILTTASPDEDEVEAAGLETAAFGAALHINRTLLQLDFGRNEPSLDGTKELIASLRVNKSLAALNLQDCNLDAICIEATG